MKTRFTLVTPPTEHILHLTTEHSASSYGQAVLVGEDGEAVDWFSFSFHEILEATDEELSALRRAQQ